MKSVEHKWDDPHDEMGDLFHHMEVQEGVELDSIVVIDHIQSTVICIPPPLVAKMLGMILEGRVIHTIKVSPHGYNPDSKALGDER